MSSFLKLKSEDLETMEFDEIYPKHKQLIRSCLAKVIDLHDFDDLHQEVLIRIAQKCKQVRNPKAVKQWLVTLCRHRICDYFRDRLRVLKGNIDIVDEAAYEKIQEGLVDYITPETIFSLNEKMENLFDAIQNLRPDYQTLVKLRDLEGLTYDEISKKLKVNIGTIKSRLFRARSAMEKDLKESSGWT